MKDLIKKYNENRISAENLFYEFLKLIQDNFNLTLVNKNIDIILGEEDSHGFSNELVNFGVRREFTRRKYYIWVKESHFTPFILLKEAYLCFLPNKLKTNRIVHIILNEIIYLDLKNEKNIEEYHSTLREKVIDYELLNTHLDRIDEFFKLKKIKGENPRAFLFSFLGNNYHIIENNQFNFFELLFKKYLLETSKRLKNDVLIETLRILIKIFQKNLIFNSLKEYTELFKKYTENQYIQTDLYQKEFKESIRWIRDHSYIGPSYQINWKPIKGELFCYSVTFNPNLTLPKITKILDHLLFNVFSKIGFSSFGVKLEGFFVIPEKYESDLRSLFRFLSEKNILHNYFFSEIKEFSNFLNLNYFREFHNKDRILNPNHVKYLKSYETGFTIQYRRKNDYHFHPDLFDWLLFNRLRYWSVTGFGFSPRAVTLSQIKKDLFNQIGSEKTLIKEFHNVANKIYQNSDLKQKLKRFIKNNTKSGFFYIFNEISKIIETLESLECYFFENENKRNIREILKDIKDINFTDSISNNLIIKDERILKLISRLFIPLYINDRDKYEKKKKEYQLFFDFFKALRSIKILDLEVIYDLLENPGYIKKIVNKKTKKFKKSYKTNTIDKITSKTIKKRIKKYVTRENPLAVPAMQTTINTSHFANYFLRINIKSVNDKVIYEHLQKFFARLLILKGDKKTYIEVYLPNITNAEKHLLISAFLHTFNENIINLNRFLHDGIYKQHSLKRYYDFEKKEFFYTEDLFSEVRRYILEVADKNADLKVRDGNKSYFQKFFSNSVDFFQVSKMVSSRISHSSPNYDSSLLNELKEFNQDLSCKIQKDNIQEIKNKTFFTSFVDKISYHPKYHQFGLSKYFLYIRPRDMNKIDYKLLFNNSFTNIQYPACIDNNIPLLLSFLFPFRTPNKSYLNLLSKSRNNILEYCLFTPKRFYNVLHFEYNLTNKGWNLEPNYFKTYVNKILFNRKFQRLDQFVKYYDFDKKSSEIYGKPSKAFQYLKELYQWGGLDLKSYLGTHFKSTVKPIKYLLKRDLIIPYLKLKNLELIEKLYIILPNIPKKKYMTTLIQIFSFFNVGHIYEIKGEYFIHNKPQIVEPFQYGLFIELYLPKDANLSDFQKIFVDIFQLFDIGHFLILPDYAPGETLINSIFDEDDILERYNPYSNLKWNETDKKWMNVKLFGENLTKIYPPLYGKKKRFTS
ncbi:MAG: hypothetical protein R6U96_13805 [Promethearchaeia archaeon]